MKKTIGTGVLLSIGTSALIPLAASLGSGPASNGLDFAALILAPGYLGYACLRETFVGRLNVHLDIGEWLLGGFLLNTLAWIVLYHAIRWAAAKRGSRDGLRTAGRLSAPADPAIGGDGGAGAIGDF